MDASTCEAKASFSSTRSMSFGSRPARSSAFRVDGTGPMPITAGSTPAEALLTIRASGSRPSSRARSSVVTTTQAAPSLIWDALPAVTVPPSRKIGLSAASRSSEVSARGPSSAWIVTGSPFGCGTSTVTISSSKRPASAAATARRCDSSANASWSSRAMP